MPTVGYSISDLARLTGVNVRTIRYYLAQGLLPASGESGPGSHYGEGHLDRLRLTRRLQQQHLPLSEIRRRLAELTDAEVSGVVAATEAAPEQTPTTSALDYVRSVLAGPAVVREPAPSPSPGPVMAAMRTTAPEPSRPLRLALAIPRMRDVEPIRPPAASESPPPDSEPVANEPANASTPESPAPERSQWERMTLGPNVELHIRRPLGRLEQRRVERLITIARQVLKEEKP